VLEFYPGILAKPFDFTKEESIEFDVDKREHCSDLAELKEFWRKLFKYQTLIRYINLRKTKKDKKDEQLEKMARDAVLKSYKYNFSRLQQGNKNDALSRYINAVVNVYDPHTIYFPPKEKEDFDMEMSGTFEGIGALLGEKDGYVFVDRIIPGGPSWRQKKLQAGDLILKVGEGDEDPVDIVGMRVVDSVKLIRGKKGTLVKLTVKRPDGQTPVISIVRDVVVLEEAFAKAAVLYHEKLKGTFGYIYLPKFYNDFSRRNGRNSADDVKKELEKLIAKNVEGIILDLRDNSGGALQDAIRMSGLFIPEGPIVQVKSKMEDSSVHEDPDPGISYEGPLVILINTLSASASEILAAALQDYNRAVIVGSANSFGKGTVQVMLNLDNYLRKKPDDIKSLGALTITIQKFYRIDGTSIQLRGVTPDIVLPDRFDYLELGEKYYEHPLEWDSIEPAPHKKWAAGSIDHNILAKKSKHRIDDDPRFQQLNDYIQRLKKIRLETLQSLQLKQVMKREEERRKESEKLKKYRDEFFPVKVTPTQEIAKNLPERLVKEKAARQKDWNDGVRKDMHLNEAMAILKDMATLQKQKIADGKK
jgi:carboxyl-terminal processing protease